MQSNMGALSQKGSSQSKRLFHEKATFGGLSHLKIQISSLAELELKYKTNLGIDLTDQGNQVVHILPNICQNNLMPEV